MRPSHMPRNVFGFSPDWNLTIPPTTVRLLVDFTAVLTFRCWRRRSVTFPGAMRSSGLHFKSGKGSPSRHFCRPNRCRYLWWTFPVFPRPGKMPEVTHRLMSESKQPFDLASGPLFRTLLFRLNGEDHILLIVFHHMLFDAWSGHVFLKEIGALYAAFAQGKPSPAP